MAKQKKGFAIMSPERRQEIARKGGRTHSTEHMYQLGKLGGRKIAQDREHMTRISREYWSTQKRKGK